MHCQFTMDRGFGVLQSRPGSQVVQSNVGGLVSILQNRGTADVVSIGSVIVAWSRAHVWEAICSVSARCIDECLVLGVRQQARP